MSSERAFEVLTEREIAIFGNNLYALTRLAELRIATGDYDGAIDICLRVRRATESWRVPTFYFWPPGNLKEIGHYWNAQIRSALLLATAYMLQGEYRAALTWAEIGHEQLAVATRLMNNVIYRLFIKPTVTFYLLHGWDLAVIAGARVGVSRGLEHNASIFEAARRYYQVAGDVDGDLLVDSIREFVTVRTGIAPTLTERVGILGERPTQPIEPADLLRRRPDAVGLREDVSLPVPEEGTVRPPRAGESTPYGFTATPAIEEAGDAFLRGDGARAIAVLESAQADAEDARLQWYLSYLHAQTLIMMGRGADAETELQRTEQFEIEAFGTNVNARALRGEARMWLGEYDASLGDFVQVIDAIGDWRVPTVFVFPPPDVPGVAALGRAHLRAYLGMAGVLMFRRDYADALVWAEEAERLFEELFYDVHHPLYSRYTAVDADMYYGRGINLGILGAARLGTTRDVAASEPYFDAANAYFDAMGYAVGRATVDALRVRVLLEIGRADLAEPLARRAAEDAVDKGLADLVWQIEALRGEALLSLGRKGEAEGAFRRAQAAVAVVSGALASDRAKRRFGVGKDEITSRLIEFDTENRDWPVLFRDLEESRARAFVDMLALRPVAVGREPETVAAINRTDEAIRRLRLLNAAPGGATAEGVRAETEALARRADLIAGLRDRDPELADVMSITTQALPDIQRRLGAGEVLVYTLPVQGHALRFLIVRRDDVRLLPAAMTLSELDAALVPFRTERPFAVADEQWRAAGAIVDGLGIADWGASHTLYVVPSGMIYFVPWGALDLDYPVVVLPTGGWLTRSPKTDPAARPAAVVGDPALGGGFPRLPEARQEAVSIGNQYGVDPRLGGAATEMNLRHDVGDGVAVLHLAAHGVFDPVNPLNSSIILSTGAAPDELTAASLFERPLPARLVVLSACETAGAEAAAGEDFLGLARSFYLGGAVTVIHSLWPVFDRPTRIFMEEFHRHARSGDYGRAWLRARDLLKREGFPPSVFGAFVLGGAPGASP